jgi:glycosyltransferase involved in cell wall biosynthesis
MPFGFVNDNRKLRIAVWHNLLSGGAKRALFDHIKGLLAFGHHIEVWSPPSADIDYLSLRSLVDHHFVDLTIPPAPRGLRRVAGIYQEHDRIVSQLNALDVHCRACAKQINTGGFDVLFANSSSILYNTPIGRYVQVPSLIYLGEPYRWLYEALPRLPWLAIETARRKFSLATARQFLNDYFTTSAYRLQAREELANAKAFDKILVNSFFSRESVARAYGLDSRVCYLGIDPSLFSVSDAKKQDYVVSLGGLYPLKRPKLAIEAIGSIDERNRPSLVWIGNFADENYKEYIVQLAKAKSVDLKLLIGISDQELVCTLQKAAVMIYTPLLEPFGYAPLEANACGTAVVGISEGGVRETIHEGLNGNLLPDCRPEPLGQAILAYTSHLKYAELMGNQARNYVVEKWPILKSQSRIEAELLSLV